MEISADGNVNNAENDTLSVQNTNDALRNEIDMAKEVEDDHQVSGGTLGVDNDIQLLNNHYIMHSRTAYEDYPEPERRRHLMRLWLATEAGPPLADPYYEFMDKTDSGRPNGYLMPGVKLTAPLVVEDGGPGASEQRVANA